MSIKERKEREYEERRKLILNAADEIIKKEGIENLSIRKLADKIEYAPSVIYHYFKDKEEILSCLMQKKYQRIVTVLASVQASTIEPEEKLVKMARSYIELALQIPDEFINIMLNDSADTLEHTSVLFRGASVKRPAIESLFQCLKEICRGGEDSHIELTAQIIWTATFGLVVRLITEKNIGEEQKQRLIEHHIQCIVAMLPKINT